MNIQFGLWNFSGQPIEPDRLQAACATLTDNTPNENHFYANEGVCILHLPLGATRYSYLGRQPYRSTSGFVITWNGRLDNRTALSNELHSFLPSDQTDVEIVAAAFERWNLDCLPKLLGDWELSVWNPRARTLLLAKDFLGSRPLFYASCPRSIAWSSLLNPLLLEIRRPLNLNEEYLAGSLSRFPADHLTPFVGIHSVPAASVVLLRPQQTDVQRYWNFDPDKRVRYRTDADYEENFRALFSRSIRRRLRSDSPVLAELSGGMDSSSIVCVADDLIRNGSDLPRVDTVSYFDDSEPNWNERPYVAEVETRRGRKGTHIAVKAEDSFALPLEQSHLAATPMALSRTDSAATQFANLLTASRYRVVLSGLGGDEVTGGVPTPIPELCDLLVRGNLFGLARQLKRWALSKRRPWTYLLADTLRSFFPASFMRKSEFPWLTSQFAKNYRFALSGYRCRTTVLGPLPSFQKSVIALDSLRRQLTACAVPHQPPFEKCYPFLDRDLLEFLYAIPREQLLRPGERRSLLRRALRGTVPDLVLDRRRKGYIERGLINALSEHRRTWDTLSAPTACERLGILNTSTFVQLLHDANKGKEVPGVQLLQIVSLEFWLRHLEGFGILDLRSVSDSFQVTSGPMASLRIGA